ncbi:MAG: hypothetical protein KDD53_06250, partial [Bdellovibrionales bacterium]|nr:hypothetical protein [Bdellovibrionales bacterium]
MPILLWLLWGALIGTYITGSIVDPDLWWHIVVGRWILSNHALPAVDHWNLFGAGHPWIAYSWLHEVAYAFTERRYGIVGLFSLKWVLAITLAWSLMATFGKVAKDRVFGGLLGAYVTVALFSHFTLRPQSFVWILFGFVVLQADQIARFGLTRLRGVLLFTIFCLWANSHITT